MNKQDVVALYDAELAKGRSSLEAFQATRTEVHAVLQLEAPAPDVDQVTDAHRVASDIARASDPIHTDAHHWLQKEHGKALWVEADKLVSAAGITASGRTA